MATLISNDPLVDLESHFSKVDVVAALVLALGLGLIYFIGSWSIVGEVSIPEDHGSIMSSSVMMSIMGLAGGSLLPEEELRARFRGFVFAAGASESRHET